MAKVLVFANHKGGSGKTTTSVHTAFALGDRGFRVLLVDLDSQAHATLYAGMLPYKVSRGIFEALCAFVEDGVVMKEVIHKSFCFDLLPSSEELGGFEAKFSSFPRREAIVKNFLLEVEKEYHFVLIDTPPSLGLLTLNALVSGDFLIIPVKVDFLSLAGLAQMMRTLYRVNAYFNPELRLLGVVPTMYDGRTRVAREVVRQLQENFGKEKVFLPIRQDVRLMESPSFGQVVFQYAPHSRGAQDYQAFVEEVLQRIGEDG
ncbi:ParA family protein [Candidatus Caldatribacterium sp. SIUC1]|uniref:ParA family protein n=1 Tax=Candidatus Caldatribacterium sp. SIUC1 TaxID=3418365 RepID=UPI003F691144